MILYTVYHDGNGNVTLYTVYYDDNGNVSLEPSETFHKKGYALTPRQEALYSQLRWELDHAEAAVQQFIEGVEMNEMVDNPEYVEREVNVDAGPLGHSGADAAAE